MKTTFFFIMFCSVLVGLGSCSSPEDEVTDLFLEHARNLDLDELEKITTPQTYRYLNFGFNLINSLGDEEAVNQLKTLATSLKCEGSNRLRYCTCLDENGQEQFFEMSLVKSVDDPYSEQLYISIDKRFFLGMDESPPLSLDKEVQ